MIRWICHIYIYIVRVIAVVVVGLFFCDFCCFLLGRFLLQR